MEEERIAALMKYVRGEISFAEWIESGVGSADTEQVEDENEAEMQDRDGENSVQVSTETAVSEESSDTPAGTFKRLYIYFLYIMIRKVFPSLQNT